MGPHHSPWCPPQIKHCAKSCNIGVANCRNEAYCLSSMPLVHQVTATAAANHTLKNSTMPSRILPTQRDAMARASDLAWGCNQETTVASLLLLPHQHSPNYCTCSRNWGKTHVFKPRAQWA